MMNMPPAMPSLSPAQPQPEHAAALNASVDAAPGLPPIRAGRIGWRLFRLAISCGLLMAILQVCLLLPHMDHATVALLMLLAVYGLARTWDSAEAISAACVGALGYTYYFLPPFGFRVESPDHIVAVVVFVCVAVAVSQLAARSKQLLAERDSLLNLSLEPLCIRDIDGNFRRVNDAMVTLLGVSAAELYSRPYLDFVHPEDHERTIEAYRSLREGSAAVDIENRYRTKDGDWRWLHWKMTPPVPGASWLNAAARDVTEENLAREKLRDLADQVLAAQEEERRHIARELHDDITQRLATLGIELGLLKRTLAGSSAGDLDRELSRLQAHILRLSDDLRTLSHSLHPSILEHSDLAASLEMHCHEFSGQHDIATTFTARQVPDTIPRRIALALYRIAQESLQNVARHSGATAASVVLAGEGESGLSLFVIDNGKGFDVAKAKSNPGLGLVSIEERTRHIGASVRFESVPDVGTRLMVQVPLAQKATGE